MSDGKINIGNKCWEVWAMAFTDGQTDKIESLNPISRWYGPFPLTRVEHLTLIQDTWGIGAQVMWQIPYSTLTLIEPTRTTIYCEDCM